MADLMSLSAASAALSDPSTPPADLGVIAQYHPGLRAAVASHPNAYPELLGWLAGLGDPAVSQAVAARRSGFGASADPITFVSGPLVPPAVAAPVSAVGAGPATRPAGRPPARSGGGVRVPVWLAALVGVVVLALVAAAVYLIARPGSGNGGTTPPGGGVTPQGGAAGVTPSRTASASPSPKTTPRAPVKPWVKTYGDGVGGQFAAIAVDTDGSVVVAGITASRQGEMASRHDDDGDGVVARLAADGTLIWATVLGTPVHDCFQSVAILPDGSIVAVGDAYSPEAYPGGASDFTSSTGRGGALAARLAADGSVVWAKSFGAVGSAGFSGVTVPPGGAIVAAGYIGQGQADFPDPAGGGLIAALSPDDGSVLWSRVRPHGYFTAVQVADADTGTVAVVGCDGETCLTEKSYGDNLGVVAEFGQDGTPGWSTVLPGDHGGLAEVAIAPDGTVIAAGWTRGHDPGYRDYSTLTAIRPDGAVAWSRTSDLLSQTTLDGVTVAPDGGIVVVGSSMDLFGDGDVMPTTVGCPLIGFPYAMVARFAPDGTFLSGRAPAGCSEATSDTPSLAAVALADPGGTDILVAGASAMDTGAFASPSGSVGMVARLTAQGTLA